jgi:hypothetical protein
MNVTELKERAKTDPFVALVVKELREEWVPEEEWIKVDYIGRTLLRMPKSQIELKKVVCVEASLYAAVFSDGYFADWTYYALSLLPNDLISADDLKRFGIDTGNPQPGGGN